LHRNGKAGSRQENYEREKRTLTERKGQRGTRDAARSRGAPVSFRERGRPTGGKKEGEVEGPREGGPAGEGGQLRSKEVP